MRFPPANRDWGRGAFDFFKERRRFLLVLNLDVSLAINFTFLVLNRKLNSMDELFH